MYKHIDEIIWKTLIVSGIISVCQIFLIFIYYVVNSVTPLNLLFDVGVWVNILTCAGFLFTGCLIWFNSIFVPDWRWRTFMKDLEIEYDYTFYSFYRAYKSIKGKDLRNYQSIQYPEFFDSFFEYNKDLLLVMNSRKNMYVAANNNYMKSLTYKSPIFYHINNWLTRNKLNNCVWSCDDYCDMYDIFKQEMYNCYHQFGICEDGLLEIFTNNGEFSYVLYLICQDINKNFIVDGKKDEHFNMYLYACLTESMTKESNS